MTYQEVIRDRADYIEGVLHMLMVREGVPREHIQVIEIPRSMTTMIKVRDGREFFWRMIRND